MLITINDNDLEVKEFRGNRVLTFEDVDTLHSRPSGTAYRNFNANKTRFIRDEDFIILTPELSNDFRGLEKIPNRGIILVTESGYLLLVKSFTDDISWFVQKQLVSTYFRYKKIVNDISSLSPQLQLLIEIELKQKDLDDRTRALQNENTKIKQIINNVNMEVQGIRDIVAINPNSDWRKATNRLISAICVKKEATSSDDYRKIREEVYKLLEERSRCSLSARLRNMKKRMFLAGKPTTFINALNNLDVISENRALIQIYVNIVKDLAIEYGCTIKDITSIVDENILNK